MQNSERMKLLLAIAAMLCCVSCETVKRLTGTEDPPPTATQTSVSRALDGTITTTTVTTPLDTRDAFERAIDDVAGGIPDLSKGVHQ